MEEWSGVNLSFRWVIKALFTQSVSGWDWCAFIEHLCSVCKHRGRMRVRLAAPVIRLWAGYRGSYGVELVQKVEGQLGTAQLYMPMLRYASSVWAEWITTAEQRPVKCVKTTLKLYVGDKATQWTDKQEIQSKTPASHIISLCVINIISTFLLFIS